MKSEEDAKGEARSQKTETKSAAELAYEWDDDGVEDEKPEKLKTTPEKKTPKKKKTPREGCWPELDNVYQNRQFDFRRYSEGE